MFQAIAVAILALSVWMLSDSDFQEWIQMLEVPQFYIGIYIILIAGLIIVGVSIFGWLGAYLEQTGKLKIVSIIIYTFMFIIIHIISLNDLLQIFITKLNT